MVVSGVELFPIDITELEDKAPVYIEFSNEDVFASQWGIVDQKRKVTIHKDFTLSFNNKCKYYGLREDNMDNQRKGVIIKF